MGYPTPKEIAVERLAEAIWRRLRDVSRHEVTQALDAAIAEVGVDVSPLQASRGDVCPF